MKSIRYIIVIAVIVGILCNTASSVAGDWAIDIKNGCKVWNTNPNKYKELLFHGECRDGYASGPGSLIFVRRNEENKVIAEGLFINGAVVDSTGYYVGKEFPNEKQIMHLFDEIEAGSHYVKTLGKYEYSKDKYEIYYIYYTSKGKQQTNNDMSIIKLDTDRWVMVLNDAKNGSKWSMFQ